MPSKLRLSLTRWLAMPPQKAKDLLESRLLSWATLSAVRRFRGTSEDPRNLEFVLRGCASPHPLAARHAYAILLKQAQAAPRMVSEGLRGSALLQPTTIGLLDREEMMDLPNLTDSLACVYYVRTLKTLAFAFTEAAAGLADDDALSSRTRLDFYRTIAKSVEDERDRVALEAIQCLMAHPRYVLCQAGHTPHLPLRNATADARSPPPRASTHPPPHNLTGHGSCL